MVAKVQDPEAQEGGFPGDPGSESRPAYGQPHLSRFGALVVIPVNLITVDLVMLGVRFEQRANGIVPSDLFQVNHRRFYEFFVYVAAIAVFGDITLRSLQALEELGFKVVTEKFIRQLQGSTGILDNLDRFDPGEFIKEPATAGKHQHGMALKFEELKGCNFIGMVQLTNSMLVHEPVNVFRRAIEDDADIFIPRFPWILQKLLPLLFVQRG